MIDQVLCGVVLVGKWNKPTIGTRLDLEHNSRIFLIFWTVRIFWVQRTAIGSRMRNAHCFGLFLPR
jgi:hypothetical protein